jgi:polysaccharide biosynthesis protein PslH
MKLLFLTPQLPYPPRQGTAIRNWGLIKSLSAQHQITLLTFATLQETVAPELLAACSQVEVAVPPAPRSIIQRLATLLTSPLPDLAHRLYSPYFNERLKALLKANQFDALFIEGLELARAAIDLDLSLPIIYDAHNCETVLQRRAYETDLKRSARWPAALYSFIQTKRLAQFEAQVCQRATRITCVSPEDATALKSLTPNLNPTVVPNGIFLSDYASPTLSPQPSAPTLVFTGKMDYRPNVDAVVWFANDILPLIQNKKPDVQFLIVGQKPLLAVQQLAQRPGITVTGAVEDIRPYIAQASLYIAPLRMGGGTRFKLLEALALKRPIVSTIVGAEGFGVQNGKELLLADSPNEFADAVLGLLDNPAKQQALIQAGYEFVHAYDWSNIVPKVEGLLKTEA